jgi:hypothetical protein
VGGGCSLYLCYLLHLMASHTQCSQLSSRKYTQPIKAHWSLYVPPALPFKTYALCSHSVYIYIYIDTDCAVGSFRHTRMHVGNVSDVSEMHATSIFRVEVKRMSEIRGIQDFHHLCHEPRGLYVRSMLNRNSTSVMYFSDYFHLQGRGEKDV